MISANGIPIIFGAAILNVVGINFLSMFIEYQIIKRRHTIPRFITRVVLANLSSVLIGTILFFLIPEKINQIFRNTEQYDFIIQNDIGFIVALWGLFFSNVMVEMPAYFIGRAWEWDNRKLISTVFLANLVTNIPVILFYVYVNGVEPT